MKIVISKKQISIMLIIKHGLTLKISMSETSIELNKSQIFHYS